MWYLQASARALVPALISTIAYLLLARNQQVREYLAFFLEALQSRGSTEIVTVLAIATLTALDLAAIMTSTVLLYSTYGASPNTTVQKFFIALLSASFGALPVIGLIECLIAILPPHEYFTDSDTITMVTHWTFGNYAILALFPIIGGILAIFRARYSAIQAVTSTTFLLVAASPILILSITVLLFPISAPVTLGALDRICCDVMRREYVPNLASVEKVMEVLGTTEYYH
jgi:hypothetical protein